MEQSRRRSTLILTTTFRELDEKAAIQRAKEEAAEAKIKAMRTGGSRIPDRTAPTRPVAVERTESSERPSGPPRLALAGNKPTWRERQAAKETEGASSGPPPAAPPSDITTEEVSMPPKKTGGYVPPARRDAGATSAPRGRTSAANDSSSTEPTAKWRPGAPRNGIDRDGSPADPPLRRNLDGLRKTFGERDSSPADGLRPTSSSGTARTESPAAERPAAGKYVPVHLRK